MDINQIKQSRPEWSALSDSQVVDMIHQLDYPDLSREQVASGLGVKLEPPKQPEQPGRGAAGWLRDVGISAVKGAIAVPEAAVGLADMVTGGVAGKALEEVGFRPAAARGILDELHTDQAKRASQAVQSADGIMGTLGAVAQNPSVIPLAAVESLPLMGGGGVMARGAMKAAPALGALGAAAAGEGIVSAGSSAEQIRQQTPDGTLTGEQAAIAGTIGALTGGLGVLGGKVAKRLGIGDVDTMLAQGTLDAGVRKGVVRSTLEGAASEGLLEELPQSVQEQALQNLALGKPIDEGVDQAAVMGALTGGVMGGGAGAIARPRIADNGPLSRAANTALDIQHQEAQQMLALPAPTIQVTPGGTAVTSEQRAELIRQGMDQKAEGFTDVTPVPDAPSTPVTAPQGPQEQIDQTLANIQAWGQRVAPVSIEKAQGYKTAFAEQGKDVEVIAHPGGNGFTVIPAQWMAPFARGGVPQELRTGMLPSPDMPAPGAPLVGDAGGIRPQTYGDQMESRAVRAAQEAEAGRKEAIGLTPDVERAAATRALPEILSTDIKTPDGQPFKAPGPIKVAMRKAGIQGEVIQVRGGWVGRPAAQTVEANEPNTPQAPQETAQAQTTQAPADQAGAAPAAAGQPAAGLPAAGTADAQAGGMKAKAPLFTRKLLPNMTEDELTQALAYYGPEHKRTEKITKEIEKRAARKVPAVQQDAAGTVAEPAANVQTPDASRTESPKLAGDKIDGEWTAFHKDSGTLGIPRADMPQIKAEHRGAMVNFLNARGIEHEQDEVAASSLKPTQAEFSPAKVAKAKEFTGGDRSILVSQDGHVVDGHHQWAAKHEAGEPVKVIRLKAPIKDLLETVKEFPSAEQQDGATKAAEPQAPEEDAGASAPQSEPSAKGGDADPEAAEVSPQADPGGAQGDEAGGSRPAPVASDQPNVKSAAKPGRLTDAGQELIRNRRSKLKGLAWDDVSAMNDTLKVAQVTKTNVWPRPDYAKMVEDGAPAWKAAALKAVYDKLAAAPVTRATPTNDDLKAYIETLHKVRDTLSSELDRVEKIGGAGDLWKTLKSENVFGQVFPIPTDARPIFGFPSAFDRTSEQGKDNNRRALLIGGNGAVQALQFNHRVISKIKDLLADGFPAKQEAWQKSFEVREVETRDGDVPEAERTGQPQQRFNVYVKGYRGRLANGAQDGGFATREQAEALARTLATRKKSKEAPPPSRGLDLDDVKRTGPDWRNGKDVTADQVMSHFGFRGVNLGEYVKAKQGIAQLHLNHVFDAFNDLADLLGVPPKAMSLGGTLGVAIGAQGSGKALAHFVPGVNEINITRDSGAGALAHEFGHALDHYFATKQGRAVAMAKRPYLSAVAANVEPGGVRPEVMAAMRHVMKTINTRPMTEAEAREYMESQRKRNQNLLGRWVKEFKSNKGADPAALDAVAEKLKRGDVGEHSDTDVESNLAEFMRAAGLKPGAAIAANAFTVAYRLRDLADEVRFMASHIPQVDTNYTKASDAMDAKKAGGEGYWSTPWEKFARAFETFAMDALKDRERESLYLSGLVDGDGWSKWAEETGKSIPYPEGAERLDLQQAFQKLVDTIETREDDAGNVGMFSRRSNEGNTLPDAVVAHKLGTLNSHPDYQAAKSGDPMAALNVAEDLVTQDLVDQVKAMSGDGAILVPVVSVEAAGRNKIPLAVAEVLSDRADLEVSTSIGQANSPKRTAMDGLERLLSPPVFTGQVEVGKRYILVDDAITQGGTFAALASHIRGAGAEVVGVVALTGKQYSAKLAPSAELLSQVREKYADVEDQFRAATGYGFDALTESEARYLAKHDDAQSVRVRIVDAGDAAGQPADEGRAGFSQARTAERHEVSPATPEQVKAVQAQVDKLVSRWKNAPDVVVLSGMEDAPAAMQEENRRQIAGGAKGNPAGFFYGGKAYVLASEMTGEQEVRRVVFHEVLGHLGLRGLYGKDLDAILRQIWNVRRDEVVTKGLSYGMDMNERSDQMRAAEEWLAEQAEKNPKLGFVVRAVAAVRSWLRRNVPALAGMRISDAEIISEFLRPVQKFIKKGMGSGGVTMAALRLGGGMARVWHGTPHRGIEKFSTDKIGTGEGAQAYGWGLYFASKREIAEHYRKGLSYREIVRQFRDALPDNADTGEALQAAQNGELSKPMADVVKALAADDWLGFDYPSQAITAAFKEIDNYDASQALQDAVRDYSGQLYGVEIPDDSEMLHWDKPMSEQPEKVQKALKELIASDAVDADTRRLWLSYGGSAVSGKKVYELLNSSDNLDNDGSGKAASMALLDNGIKGIKYLDGSSRGTAGQPTLVVEGKDVVMSMSSNTPDERSAHTRLLRSNGNVDEAISEANDVGASKAEIDYLEKLKGKDVVVRREGGSHNYVVFSGDHVSIVGTGFSRTAATHEYATQARNAVADFLGSAGAKVDWLDKSLKTQYAKAQKFPEFGKVFDKLQQYIEGVSSMANQAADQAPSILPKLDTFSDLWKHGGILGHGLSKADREAVAAPIFEGTLEWTRDEDGKLVKAGDANEAPGVVFSDAELRDRFKLTDAQIGQYREFRAAVDESLDQVVAAEVARLVPGLPDRITAMAQTSEGRQGMRAAVEKFLGDESHPLWADVHGKFDKIEALKARGYAPLSRFGKFFVHVVQDGETKFFGLAESVYKANTLARDMRQEFKGAEVEQGVISQEQYKLMSAVPIDAMEVFAQAIGAEQSDVFQKYIQLAKNNRSTMKRLIRRKGTAGFSDDVPRVLANFITGNARASSAALHIKQAKDLALKIKHGDVKDQAGKLIDAVTEPEESGAVVRGMMFVNFIGGSIASAVVNLTQPIMMTLPYLSQWGGGAKASARLIAAAKMAVTRKGGDDVLNAALKRAEDDGIVAPQEIHHLIQRATSGSITGGALPKLDIALQKLAFVWGAPFSLAESFNRRASFIAAYQTAREEGIADPYSFAEKAVVETQGLYNSGNKPNAARGVAGSFAMTFKQFSIHYLEWLARMAKSGPEGKKAALLALAMLMLAAGADGLPFMDDMDDLIDTAGQAMGYDTNTKHWRHEAINEVLGDTLGEVAARGFSAAGGFPLDVSMRMGMGNLIPASDYFMKSNTNKQNSLYELAGAGGGLLKQYSEAAQTMLNGEAFEGGLKALPVALQNVGKAAQIAATGEYRDARGKKVMDADGVDAGVKLLGFQPAEVARESSRLADMRQSENLAKLTESEITDKWARAIADGDKDLEREALAMRDDWNQKNPEAPIRVKRSQANKKARQLRMDRKQRFIKTVAPERRAAANQEINQ